MSLPKTFAQFIWYFIKKFKYHFLVIQIFALAWALDNTVWPYAFSLLIDKIIAYTGDKSDVWIYLYPVLAFWGGLWIIIEVMYRIEGILMAKTYPLFEAKIRMSMFQYVEGHSYEYFATHFAGNISNKISDMAASSTRILQLVLALFIPAITALMIAGTVFYFIQPLFALLLLGWAALHISICLFASKKSCDLSNIHSNSRSYLTGKIVDTFSNIINVKLFSHQRFEYDYINQYQQDEQQKYVKSLMYVEMVQIFLGISSILFPGILLTWYEIYCWQHGLITVGQLVLLFNTTWNITMLTWYVGIELPNLYKEIGICQQALSIIRAPHDIINKKDAINLVAEKGEIKFDHVTFFYHKKNPIFSKLSVTIAAGSKVGLVGFSGSGKSTFVNLILRFFDIQYGHIFIDDLDIRHATIESLRQQIAMIPQDPTLFHRTVKENIRYGKIQSTDEEVILASTQAHCHDFIKYLVDGYDTLVGERGIKLSGGQRQRIAIARAILKNAPILILDEATSALDSVTEKHIQDALHFLMQGRTTLIVAHRLSTLSEMDRILVFDKGRIIEDGKHEELITQNGHYAKLWQMQAGGFLPDKTED